MSRVEDAMGKFNNGSNCAQSIIGTYGPLRGLTEADCLRIGSGFGSGMRRAEVCGAVSGSIMVLGLDFQPSDLTGVSKDYVNQRTLAFTNKFGKKCGSILCRDLLSCDVSTPEGELEAKSKETSQTICPGLVQAAAELVEEFILLPEK